MNVDRDTRDRMHTHTQCHINNGNVEKYEARNS